MRLCKDRTYCWAGGAWLATRLETSPGTVKRWLTQLVSAGLIRRTPRPGGDTALTSIPALAAFDDQIHPVRDTARHAVKPVLTQPSVALPSTAPFFAPAERITNESHAGSAVSRHTIKRPDRNLGLVGSGEKTSDRKPQEARQSGQPATPTVQRLIDIGVADPSVLQELAAMPLGEIDAICRYVATQPNSYNPPGLIIALARTGLGPALLRKPAVGASRSSGARTHRAGGQSVTASSVANTTVATAPLRSAVPSAGAELWAAAKQELSARIPPTEFAAWLDTAHLVTFSDGEAIIGVPNVFAREELDITYRSIITDAIATLTHPGMMVQVVID